MKGLCPFCKSVEDLNENICCMKCYSNFKKDARSIDLFRTKDVNPFGEYIKLKALAELKNISTILLNLEVSKV